MGAGVGVGVLDWREIRVAERQGRCVCGGGGGGGIGRSFSDVILLLSGNTMSFISSSAESQTGHSRRRTFEL